MKEYLVRIDDNGLIASFEPIEEDCLLDEVLRDFMKEMRQAIKDHKKCIQDLEGRIKELEARPYGYYPITYPVPNTGDHVPYPWTITCKL